MINFFDTPKFITFEGGEGCGKSTQSKMLYERLKAQNIDVILTREVGGTPEAEKIRKVLLHSDLLAMSELMLVMAARYEHLSKVVIPALQNGYSVICDRFIDSTACYQGLYDAVGVQKVYDLHNQLIPGGLMPDITFFIDIPPNIALQRAIERENNNKFEEKLLQFHQLVYEGFQDLACTFTDRIMVVDGAGLSKEAVHEKIFYILTA